MWSTTKVWGLCHALKELLFKAVSIEDSCDHDVICWIQDLIKMLNKYELSKMNIDDVFCENEEEKLCLKNLIYIKLPILEIESLRVIAERRNIMFSKSCAAK